MTIQTIARLSDNMVVVDGLQRYDPTLDDYVWENMATVECTLQDLDGNPVPGQAFPFPLSYVDGSNGRYTATLEDTLELEPLTEYTTVVRAVIGGYVKVWEIPTVAYTDGITPTYRQLECVVNLPDPCLTG